MIIVTIIIIVINEKNRKDKYDKNTMLLAAQINFSSCSNSTSDIQISHARCATRKLHADVVPGASVV